MAKKIQRTHKTRRQPRRAAPQDVSDGTGLLLVASAIGHIAQASRSGGLQRKQQQLEAVLRDWQEGYQRLNHQFSLLRAAYQGVASRLEQAEQERTSWRLKWLALQDGKQKKTKGEGGAAPVKAARVLRDFESERAQLLKADRKLASIAAGLAPAARSSGGSFWLRPGGLELVSATLDRGGQALVVTFAKGGSYRLPVERLGLSSRVVKARLDDLRHGVLLGLADGRGADVASDFILFECDPGYRSSHAPRDRRPSIGQNIRSIRMGQGRSAREVAAAAGLAPPNLARLEAGRHEPKIETLVRLAGALRVPLAELLRR